MAKAGIGVKPINVSIMPIHVEALERYAAEFGYPGRSPALRRILDLSPDLKPYLQEEPTPCPSTS